MKPCLKTVLPVFTLLLATILQAQDFTGTWEGQQIFQNKRKLALVFYLAKTEYGYFGILTLKENSSLLDKVNKVGITNLHAGNINFNNNANNNGGSKMQMKGMFVCTFDKDKFRAMPIGILETNDAGNRLLPTDMTYEEGKGNEKLSFRDAQSQIELTKKSTALPSELADYNKDVVSFSDIKFSNGKKEPKIIYNDKGLLSFTATNTTNFDIQNISISIQTQGSKSGLIGLDGNKGTFSLGKLKSISPEIDIMSGFNLPNDSIRFSVVGTYQGIPVFNKRLSLATVPFFLNDKTVVKESSEKTLSALQKYYGFNNTTSGPVVTQLNQLIASGNKSAPMWKAIYLVMGYGGYPTDEEAALPLAKKAYSDVLLAARDGDAEAQYLLFYAIGMGLSGELGRDVAGDFLKRSAEAGFLPAMYDYALYLMKDTAYAASYKYLVACYDKGMQRAATTIAYCNQKGYGVEKDANKAIEWYLKAESFGDQDGIMKLAKLFYVGDEGLPRDTKKAIQYANKSAELKNPDALNFLARIYLNGRNDLPKNAPKALALYKEAAGLGDNTAMTALSLLYLSGGSTGIPKDSAAGLAWAKKSAEAGGGECMLLLSDLYATGKIGGKKDIIKSRFWANQARIRGVGESDNSAYSATSNDMMNILGNIDMSDHYSYYRDRETGDVFRTNDGPDIFGSLLGSVFSANAARRSQQQPVINGVEYIYTAGGKKIYGGTLTSKTITDIMVIEGQKIKMQAYGLVSVGMIAGNATPDGIGGFQQYSVDPGIPHGSIMAKTGGNWIYVGSNKTITAAADGKLQLAINDADYTNNKGYFDVVITVEQ